MVDIFGMKGDRMEVIVLSPLGLSEGSFRHKLNINISRGQPSDYGPTTNGFVIKAQDKAISVVPSPVESILLILARCLKKHGSHPGYHRSNRHQTASLFVLPLE